MSEPVGDGTEVIRYRVKDLFASIDTKLDRIFDKLDQKADRADVHDLKTRVAALELTALKREGPIVHSMQQGLESLERWRASVSGSEFTRKSISASALAWAALLVALVAAIATIVWLTH